MKISRLLIIAAAVCGMAACSNDDEGGKQQPPIQISLDAAEAATVQNYNDLAFRTFAEIYDEGHNVVYSPLSAQMGLAMLANGASGETLDEILAVLCPDGSLDAMNSLCAKLMENLPRTDPKSRVAIANAAWHDQSVALLPDFELTIADFFNASAKPMNAQNPQQAAADINAWASDNTSGVIKQMLKPEHISPLLLLNAMYFKAEWTHKFDKKDTRKDSFYNCDGVSTTTDFMTQENDFVTDCYRLGDGGMEMVELPFGNDAYRMMLLLPPAGTSPAEALAAVRDNWQSINEARGKEKCYIKLPKFKAEASHDLLETFRALGLRRTLDLDRAQLDRLTGTPGYIAHILQGCKIEVDEDGAVAAAATSVGEDLTAYPGKPLVFDHPFAYMIRESSTGLILFMGVVNRV